MFPKFDHNNARNCLSLEMVAVKTSGKRTHAHTHTHQPMVEIQNYLNILAPLLIINKYEEENPWYS